MEATFKNAFTDEEIKRAHVLIHPIIEAFAVRIWETAQSAAATYVAAEMPGCVTESEIEKDEPPRIGKPAA